MSEPIRVLIADDMSKKAVEILQQAGFSVDYKVGLPPADLAAIIGEYHGLGIRSATKVTPAILANPGKLKIIGRAGVGVDNIDVKTATEKKVLVINTPQGNAAAAAELSVGLIFALARKIPQAAQSMRQEIWEKKKYMGTEIAGKTLGVIGLGNIGRQVAERAVGLKMNVLGYDPYVSTGTALPGGVKVTALPELIEKSDFITLHVPMLPETKDLFNAATIAKMKKGSYLINVARGGIVDENAVLEALKSGHLAGAALDVFSKEPPEPSPLFAEENLIAIPHLGASTREAQEKVAIELAEVFVGFLKDGVVRNAVNKI
ncbi:MAG: D-3-phosphoglycerate dehydrogenase / 2-oxoglutarate reductase [Myxococcales bacterium]|jgi:D-3-phosphoglycerate dehydrogenase|nr:D-3-phosphoglycerate dehydrogenase / 2-oxoglutarate reductase [Myxococcales bacterium]